jgi:hypothetical protein
MAFFYPPPPPSQGSTASTLPIPHAQQQSGESQPPLRQVQAVVAMVAVLASWPASLEPRLQAPNNQQNKIAPLTLPYGQQPPPAESFIRLQSAWKTEWSAQKALGNAAIIPPPFVPPGFVPFAPLPGSILRAWTDTVDVELVTTWTIGPDNPDQPPIAGPLSPTDLAIVRSWPTDWPAQRPPINAAIIPPPSAAVVPFTRPPSSIGAWPIGWTQPQKLVTRVQTTGDQPPITGPLTPTELAIQRSWSIDWPSQHAPLLVQPSSGDQPVRQNPLLVSQQAQIVLAWQVTWSSQSKAVAATQPTTPTINVGPLPTADVAIVGAWPRGWDQPQRLTTLKQPSTGDQPSPQGALTPTELLIQRLWPTDWPAQTGPKLAAWFVPPVVNQPTPIGPISPTNLALVVGSWPTAWAAQSRPIVLIQPSPGAQPIPQGPLSASEISESVGAWPTTWPAQGRPVVVVQGQGAPPVIGPLPSADLPIIVASWPTSWAAQSRPVTAIQPGSSQPVPSGPLSVTEVIVAVRQWAQSWPAQSRPLNTASLPTGTAPPPAMPLRGANLSTIVAQWQPNWPAQSIKPRRNDSAIIHFKPEWAANSNQLLGPSKSQPETH